jgi:preprotein translocase subunit SecG
MGTFISVLIVIVCILLCIVVLIQNSKGGGLSSSFASSNQVMGVKKTGDFLEKATWTLAVSLLALSIFSASYTKPTSANGTATSKTKQIEETAPSSAPATNAVPLNNTTPPLGGAPK